MEPTEQTKAPIAAEPARVKLTKHQNAAIREDNIAGGNLVALIVTEIAGLEAEIRAKQQLIEARRASIAVAGSANKRFTDMLLREAGLDPADYESYEIKDEPDGPVMILKPKPKPGPSADELERQKQAALAQAKE